MRISSGRSKNYSTRGTSIPPHHLAGVESYWYRRKMELGNSALITGPWIKSQLEIDT
jgi:hypothetical protein